LWHYGFCIARQPVTHLEYLRFLNALVAAGRAEEARDRVPILRTTRTGEPVPLYHIDGTGEYVPAADGPLGPISPDAPVSLVTWYDAVAYCLWLSEVTGLPWRLPSELEREKAGRGVDGRAFPWGGYSDPTFHCTQDSPLDQPAPPPTDGYPIDTSPYGVRGLAGGLGDWCIDTFRPRGPVHKGAVVEAPPPLLLEHARPEGHAERRAVRGGAFDSPSHLGRCAARAALGADRRRVGVGFRLAFSLESVWPPRS
jgi:serine/threonine-protein kinase